MGLSLHRLSWIHFSGYVKSRIGENLKPGVEKKPSAGYATMGGHKAAKAPVYALEALS